MSLLTSSLYSALKEELSVGMEKSSGNVSVTFKALSIANGTDRDDEEKIQNAVDTITNQLESELGVDINVNINWLECIVMFNIIYTPPPPG